MENKDPVTKGKTLVGVLAVLFVAVAAIAGAVIMDNQNQNQMQKQTTTFSEKNSEGQESRQQMKTTEKVSEEANAIVSESESIHNTIDAAVATANLSFDENSVLDWPVEGQILIPYSMDTTTYFRTLHEYKVNDAVMIAADKDMEVICGAKGVVTRAGTNEEVGNFIVMNVGNDYLVTYGNLNEDTWEAGQVIDKGDVIGTIAEPTKYYTMEGCNLYLRMEKNGESLDPLNYLNYEDVAADAFTDEEPQEITTEAGSMEETSTEESTTK